MPATKKKIESDRRNFLKQAAGILGVATLAERTRSGVSYPDVATTRTSQPFGQIN
jgi:hypothetical protein